MASGLPVELEGGRQRAEPFEDGNVHRLSFYIIAADQHGNEQDRHHQVLGEGKQAYRDKTALPSGR